MAPNIQVSHSLVFASNKHRKGVLTVLTSFTMTTDALLAACAQTVDPNSTGPLMGTGNLKIKGGGDVRMLKRARAWNERILVRMATRTNCDQTTSEKFLEQIEPRHQGNGIFEQTKRGSNTDDTNERTQTRRSERKRTAPLSRKHERPGG